MLLFATALCHASEPLTSGELYDTAHTLEPGAVTLHPAFNDSIAGVTPWMDVKFRTLAMVAGPKLGVELGYRQHPFAVSVEPFGWTGWGGNSWRYGGDLRFSHQLGEHRLNLNAGWSHGQWATFGDVSVVSTRVPLRAGVDLVASETAVFQISAASNARLWSQGTQNYRLRFHFNGGGNKGRLGLGFDIIRADLPPLPDWLEDVMGSWVTIPLPYVASWWRF